MDPSSWVKEQLIPKMVACGRFGNRKEQRVRATKCEVTHRETGDNFNCTVLIINLEIKIQNQAPQAYSLFVKVSPQDPLYRKYFDIDVLFHNETLMYTEIIPFATKFLRNRQADLLGEMFAKCYYAKSGAGCNDIVVLEDMTTRGFTPCAERLFLDYDHCAVALKQLARFHAVFYGMKMLDATRFHAMVKKIRTQNIGSGPFDDVEYFFRTTSYRAVRYLEGRKEMDQAVLDRLKGRLEKAGQLLAELTAPKEPLAVLCHGDFCRNNILFRYDSGKPRDAVLLDFQVVKHGSPAIDLSFFMYLNTSSELRNQHWDDLFGEYHATLTGTLARILGCSVEELLPDYGLEAFQKDFVAHGLYGYMICSFFLTEMCVDRKDQVDHHVMCEKGIRVLADTYVSHGGELASQKLADILKHLASKNAI